MACSFTGLIDLCRSGDREAADQLLSLVRPMVLKTAWLFSNDSHSREDNIQEGFFIVLESIKSYDTRRGIPYLAYLKSALYYGIYRSVKKRLKCFHLLAEGDAVMEGIGDSGPSTEELALQWEEREELYNALETLTLRQKKVIMDIYMKNMSIKNISREMGISYIGVIKLRDRALERLRKILKSPI
jgi:RNA polymerase sporulation-specific sigma factor